MALVAEGISKIVSIKIKARHDSYTDQYNRIFMSKMCVLSSIIIGVNYYSDKVSCIIANNHGMDGGFVGSACWIQGFYIFKEMIGRLKESGYYGIPRNMDYDGINSLGQLCSTENRALDKVPGCKPMTKLYYLQYQYMPFFMAALALTFYIPYLVFRVSNNDLISLKDTMKGENVDPDDIVKNYFNYRVNSKVRMKFRVLMNIIVKIMYVIANVVTLMATDFILHGHYINYGVQFTKWTKLDNDLGHDHDLKIRSMPKPGNVLLPPMGFCDLHEATRDIRNTFINKHKFICEISPHVLYQYVLVLLWYLLIIGIVISLLGLVLVLFGHLINFACFAAGGDPAKKMFKVLTLRELDYLEYIRKKNIPVYGEVIRKLREERADMPSLKKSEIL